MRHHRKSIQFFFFHFHLCVVASFAMTSHFNWKLETVFWVRRIELVDLHKKMSFSLSLFLHTYLFIYLCIHTNVSLSPSPFWPLSIFLLQPLTRQRDDMKKKSFRKSISTFWRQFFLFAVVVVIIVAILLLAFDRSFIYDYLCIHAYIFFFVRSLVRSVFHLLMCYMLIWALTVIKNYIGLTMEWWKFSWRCRL